MYKLFFFLGLSLLLIACTAATSAESIQINQPGAVTKPYIVKGITYYPLSTVSDGYVEVGVASWYGKEFHGKLTSSGEVFDMYQLTAAHKTLPFPTYVNVENLDNGRSVVVKVNDRGPFTKGRILDLSYAAAEKLGMIVSGTAKVRLTVLSESKDHLRTENRDVDITKGVFGVQLGAFTSKENAVRLATKFNHSEINEATVKGAKYYRVQVFGYNTIDAAMAAAKQFEAEYNGAFIIAK